jgi:hypothetical protein
MKMRDVTAKAKALSVEPSNLSKEELIRAIQTKEGNFPCFGTADGKCDQTGCLWMTDCAGKA